jgi:predicted nucleic acid-binding protein
VTFRVVLDTNVLVPASLFDLVLSQAGPASFTPLWSKEILSELTRVQLRRGVPEEVTTKRLETMKGNFPFSCVSGYKTIEKTLNCPDPEDNHVLAAAIHGRAGAIVTADKRGFPVDCFEIHGVEIVGPEDFLLNQLDFNPENTYSAVARMLNRWKNPPGDQKVFLDRFGSALPTYCDLLVNEWEKVDFYRVLEAQKF